ncbi:MAG: DNA repair protein RecO [Parasphingopyxis sp.]|uniref:DNA repair protein RecO n=1 Tax=Parasphingopyxis sp. TaxID=1920299 RepID=UPI003FA105F7
MHLRTRALVCAIRPHGEHGAIARLMTPDNGLVAGYVRGGRSRRIRPILLPGNIVEAEFRARTDEQLAGLTVELVASRSGLYAEPLAAAAIEWACALTAAVLPEGHRYPHVHAALDGVLGAIEAAPSARRWAASLVRYEVLILRELGFGLDPGKIAIPEAMDDWDAIFDGFRLTGHFLGRDLLDERRNDVMAARERLVERLKRAA